MKRGGCRKRFVDSMTDRPMTADAIPADSTAGQRVRRQHFHDVCREQLDVTVPYYKALCFCKMFVKTEKSEKLVFYICISKGCGNI